MAVVDGRSGGGRDVLGLSFGHIEPSFAAGQALIVANYGECYIQRHVESAKGNISWLVSHSSHLLLA